MRVDRGGRWVFRRGPAAVPAAVDTVRLTAAGPRLAAEEQVVVVLGREMRAHVLHRHVDRVGNEPDRPAAVRGQRRQPWPGRGHERQVRQRGERSEPLHAGRRGDVIEVDRHHAGARAAPADLPDGRLRHQIRMHEDQHVRLDRLGELDEPPVRVPPAEGSQAEHLCGPVAVRKPGHAGAGTHQSVSQLLVCGVEQMPEILVLLREADNQNARRDPRDGAADLVDIGSAGEWDDPLESHRRLDLDFWMNRSGN